ncbi:MAG: EscU/YscU/HrcU family type III secretion system export apparatus switch protein, partial [Planctomycetota bacterium]
MTESQKRELKKLEEDIDELKSEKRAIETENDSLRREKEKLKQEVKGLISLRDEILPWRHDATFVMLNPTEYALGIVQTPEGTFRVTRKAKGIMANAAKAAASGVNIPTIGMNPELTRRIYNRVEEGDLLPSDLAGEVGKYWKPHRYGIVSADDGGEFVVFRDVKLNKSRIGFVDEITESQLTMFGLSGGKETVPRARIEPGSARRGTGEEILASLADSDFLDYCLLRVVQHLQTDAAASKRRVAMNVQCDLDSQNVDYIRVALGSLQFERRSTPGRSDLGNVAKYVEDEIYAKLSKASNKEDYFELREREQLDQIVKELFLPEILFSRLLQLAGIEVPPEVAVPMLGLAYALKTPRIMQLAGATHILSVDLKPPLGSGEYHISVRLVEVATSNVVFAEQGDRSYVCPSEMYFLQSGTLFEVKFKNDGAVQNTTLEQPQLAPRGRIGRPIDSADGLMLFERRSDEGVFYRTLYGRDLLFAPVQNVSQTRRIDKNNKPNPLDHQRYALWLAAQTVMPPSGFVTGTDPTRAQADVSIGGSSKLAKDDLLKVVRPQSKSEAMLPLATELVVTSVGQTGSVVAVRKSGMEKLFPAESYLQPGDIVYRPVNYLPTAAIREFNFKGPINQRDAVKLKWNIPARRQRFHTLAGDAALQMRK